VARLGVGLSRQVEELDASRRRIAVAADEERRRIQRDLHDGAQQRLVAVGLTLRSLEGRFRADDRNEDADAVDGVVADLGATIEELRTLVDNLPLPQLDAGLEAAFQELADRSPLPVQVEVVAGKLDPSVEAAAYFVGSESLTNTLKHAQASTVTLRAERCGGTLLVTVADDGVGGAVPGVGSGLIGLRDRVAAIGGRLRIDSGRTGTIVTAELPCG
jgi:signal transduction histidine kinase